MKMKKVRRLLSVLLTGTLIFSLSNFAAGASDEDPVVTYNVATQEFSFSPELNVDENGHPDLFPDMKNLMPGDSVEQIIHVKVVQMGSDTVNMTLKALPCENLDNEEDADQGNADCAKLMEWATLTVEDLATGEQIQAKMSEEGGAQLAEFSSGKDEQQLKVTLTIHKEAGNELQNLLAKIDWVFHVEVIPHGGGSSKRYDLTVNYLDQDGNKIHPSYEKLNIRKGTSYDVTDKDAIEIDGYTYVKTTGDSLTGTMNSDKVINVCYEKIEDIPDPKPPIDPGTGPDVPGPDVPGPDVPGPDVPGPVEPTPNHPKPPKTGDSSMFWLTMSVLSGAGLVVLALTSRKKEEP